MGGPTAGEKAEDAAQEAAAAGPRDISELLAQALDAYRPTAARGDGAALEAPGRGANAGELIAQALAAVAPRAEGTGEKPFGGGCFGGTGRGARCAGGAGTGGGRRGRGAQWEGCQGGRSGGLDVGVAGLAPGGAR